MHLVKFPLTLSGKGHNLDNKQSSFLFGFLLNVILLEIAAANSAQLVNSSETLSKENCEFPVVSTLGFQDKDSKDVILTNLNSSLGLNVETSFPYQYLMLTCSAPFPVEWAFDTLEGSKPNYYSYVLDGEIRQYSKQEKYTVRHHIGNDTLAKDAFTNLTVTCEPVAVESEDYTNASINHTRPCGNTSLILRKHKNVKKKPNNRSATATLSVSFNEAEYARSDNTSSNATNELCLKDERWSSLSQLRNASDLTAKNVSAVITEGNQTFVCESSKEWSSSSVSSSLPEDLSLGQLRLNESELHNPFGVLECAPPNSTYKNGTEVEDRTMFHVPYYFSLPRLCSNEDSSLPHLYLRRPQSPACSIYDLVHEEELLSLCVQHATIPNATNLYVGDEIVVSCISSIYYFAEGMIIQTISVSDDKEGRAEVSQTVISSNHTKERSVGSDGYRNLTTSFQIKSDTIQKLQCLAPVRRSRRWVTKAFALEVKIPSNLSFDERSESETRKGSDTFLLCNATGDPLPSLSWSRLNNGRLPTNQSTEIQSFSRYPSTNPTHQNKTNSTWISSKLYLPTGDKSEKEYYGRYICTARNRFESIEKVFLYDGENDEPFSVFGQNATMKTIGKTIWFWLMVVLSVFAMVALLIVLGLKVREQAKHLRLFTKAEIDEFMFGKPELLLDDSDTYEEINSYAAYLPYDRNQFEIRREQLEFNPTDILGCGAYGTVYKGVFLEKGRRQPVAVKTVNSTSDKMYFAALLSEIKIMCYVGKHENVVRLVGACTKYLDKRQIFVATEFCENGDLLSYIEKHRETFINNAGLEHALISEENGVKRPDEGGYIRLSYARLLLSPRLLLVWALQITKGMAFLSSKKVIHGDLAARNILLGTDLQPKIGDFGLSKQLQNYANYVQKGDDLVPWKWLAIESLQYAKFSLQSDVWAFGVVLFEILSLGQVPYANYTYSELFIVALCQGERLPKPLFASDKLYELMLDCWKHLPEDRPTFVALENALKILILENENKVSVTSAIDCDTSPNNNESATLAARYVNAKQMQEKIRSPYLSRFEPKTNEGGSFPTTQPQLPTSSYVTDWKAVS